jgi:hypothetical protein
MVVFLDCVTARAAHNLGLTTFTHGPGAGSVVRCCDRSEIRGAAPRPEKWNAQIVILVYEDVPRCAYQRPDPPRVGTCGGSADEPEF